METEVRYHMLRPAQIVARRKACPVAYVPLGTIEWHGEHNPVGADSLQAEGLAVVAARRFGGLVFPALYYGENRLESLMDANAADRAKIAQIMDLPPDNFRPEKFPTTPSAQSVNYQTLLQHILHEVESLGFQLGVLVCGHYPLIDHARAATLLFNQRERTRHGGGLLAWACADYLLLKPHGYPNAGDHAAGWETSHLMVLHPETVDLSVLPPKGAPLVGVGGSMAPQDSSVEFGQETLEAAARVLGEEVRQRLENTQYYRGHGQGLHEGRWQNPAL